MGKSKKEGKNNQPNPKVPLDEQISQGRVSKPKNNKIRLRAEEEGVS